MSSTEEIEKTLPLKAPDAAFPLLGPKPGVHYSVYILTTIDQSTGSSLLERINGNNVGTRSCRFAPQGHVQTTVRDAYDHHLSVRDMDDSVHPYIFIILDDPQARCALVMYLKAPTTRKDVKSVVGVLRCDLEEADLIGCNLDVGNVDWIEYKESEQEDWSGSDPYANERYFATDPRENATAEEPKHKYAWFSLVQRAVPISTILEPGWADLEEGQSCFGLAGNVSSYDDPWIEIRKLLPYACWTTPRIDRRFFLVADHNANYGDADVAMSIYRCKQDLDVELSKYPDYDPDVYARNQSHQHHIQSIMPEIEFVEHTMASKALDRLEVLTTGA